MPEPIEVPTINQQDVSTVEETSTAQVEDVVEETVGVEQAEDQIESFDDLGIDIDFGEDGEYVEPIGVTTNSTVVGSDLVNFDHSIDSLNEDDTFANAANNALSDIEGMVGSLNSQEKNALVDKVQSGEIKINC